MTQSQSVRFQRDVEVRHEVDVFVAGGGPAGAAAAITAARQGRSVFLAEGHSCFGGMGTAGLVPAFMTFGDSVHFLAGGFGRELLSRLEAAGGAWPRKVPDNNRCSVGIDAEVLKRVYDELVAEAGVRFAFHTQLVAVQAEPARVAAAICAAKSGLFAVKAGVYIDGTGDGDLAAWAGAPFEKGDEQGNLMPGTLCSLWADVDWEAVAEAKLKPRELLAIAVRDGSFSVPDLHLPGIWRVGERMGGGNIGHTFGVDGTDERSLTEALVHGRRLALEYHRFYREYLKGYERMALVGTGSLLGLRETRRILGDYVLCLDDFNRRAVFEDEIGRYCYPVDIHPSRPDAASFKQFEKEWTTLRYKEGESYGIPYRCLLPRGLDNVLVAGRCISADRFLQGSVRVMPGCYITGQAAGMAAALAAEAGVPPRAIDVKTLQRRLKAMGAHLPNSAA